MKRQMTSSLGGEGTLNKLSSSGSGSLHPHHTNPLTQPPIVQISAASAANPSLSLSAASQMLPATVTARSTVRPVAPRMAATMIQLKDSSTSMSPHFFVASEAGPTSVGAALYTQYSASGLTQRQQVQATSGTVSSSSSVGLPQQQPDVQYSTVMTTFSTPTVCQIVSSQAALQQQQQQQHHQHQYQLGGLESQLSQLAGQQQQQLVTQHISPLPNQQHHQNLHQLSQLQSGQALKVRNMHLDIDHQ